MGRPHCAASRGLWLPSTSMHQARIILAVHGFEASVAQAPALRQTTAHPEPERVVTETCAWAGRFHPTDGPRSRRARSRGRCGIHVYLKNDYQPILVAFMKPAGPTFAFLGGDRLR